MKRIFIVIALALSVSGCINPFELLTQSTASISNPVTPVMLYEVENAATVAFAGLNAYKRSCVELVLPQNCRGIIKKIQVYTRKLPPTLTQLRKFVRNNDQVNAVIAYNVAMGIITEFKKEAAANSVQVQ